MSLPAPPSPAMLVLEDGRTFHGDSYGAEGETFGEAVFSTGMTGYQETLTDPSYHRQVVVMTAPHVGNTGMNDEDPESRRIWVSGYVVRDPARIPSSWRSRRSLDDALREQGVVGISGVDTRALTRHLRERGAMRVGISTTETDPAALLDRVRRQPAMAGADLAGEVTTPEAVRRPGRRREAVHGGRASTSASRAMTPRADGRARDRGPRAAQHRDRRGRARHAARRRLLLQRPGRPARPPTSPPLHRRARARHPLLRHLLRQPAVRPRARASAPTSSTYGHRGINQPVMDRTTGKVEVTAHNHGFAVDAPRRPAHHHAVRRGDRVATSASTTTWSRASSCATATARCAPSASSTTRRPRPARTTPRTSSTGSATSWRACRRFRGCAPLAPRRRTSTSERARPTRRARSRYRTRKEVADAAGATDIQSVLVIGSGPDRDRAGLRVRLLRHPGLPGAAGRGAAGGPGQLQPGDDHDRPRVRRRDVRRADHARSSSRR